MGDLIDRAISPTQAVARWTPPAVNRAAELWAEKLTCREIARTLAKEGRKFTPLQVTALISRRRDIFPHKSEEEIVQAKQRAFRPPKRRKRKPKFDAKVVKTAAWMWKNGRTVPEIAKHLDLSQLQVLGIKNRYRERFPQKHGPNASGTITIRRPGKLRIVDTARTEAA